MKTKILFMIPLFLLTACGTPQVAHKDPVINPQGFNPDDLIKTQTARIEKLERDMEKREAELKYQHLKELTQVQIQQKNRPSEGHISCKFFCF